MKNPGFTFCWLILIVAGAAAILTAGPCDGLSKVGETIGEKMAAEQMKERDAREKALQIEMQRLWEEKQAAQPTP